MGNAQNIVLRAVSKLGLSCLLLAGLSSCDDLDVKVDIGSILVFESKEAVQCQDAGLSLEESAQGLVDEGIDVISSKCAYINLLDVVTVCGVKTNEIIVHEIPLQSLIDAIEVGFMGTEAIDNDYTVYECS